MFSEFYEEQVTAIMVSIRCLNTVFVSKLIMDNGNNPPTCTLYFENFDEKHDSTK